jgi:hypothetical protein
MTRDRRLPIADRILAVLDGKKSYPYHILMELVFPEDEYPKAFNYQANGGPPGCAMAFNKALRKMGANWYGMGSQRMAYFE